MSKVPRFVVTLALTVTVTAATAVAAVPAGADTPVTAAARSTWHVTDTLGLAVGDVATSCPTVTVCTAVAGGELVTTADGGGSWTRRTPNLPGDVVAVTDLACPTATVCVLLAARDDGTTAVLTGPEAGPFTTATTPAGGSPTAVDCPGAEHCLVTDGAMAWTTHDLGATWQPSSLPRTLTSVSGISCVGGTDRCAVYGNYGGNAKSPAVEVTTDDGRTWEVQDPGVIRGLAALDCPTTTVCVAGGGSQGGAALLRRTTDGGTTWTGVSAPRRQFYGLTSISCAGATSCSAFGATPDHHPFVWSTTDGTTWTAGTLPTAATDPSAVAVVECPAAGRCRAVAGGTAFLTADAGATWTAARVPAALGYPRDISCVDARRCLVAGSDAADRPISLTSVDRGASWLQRPMPAEAARPDVVDCVAGTRTCVAVGNTSAAGGAAPTLRPASTTDLGATWVMGSPTDVRGFPISLSCPTVTTCLLGGYDDHAHGQLWATTDGAATWAAVTPPAGLPQLSTVACTGPTTCIVMSKDAGNRAVAARTTDLGGSSQLNPMPRPDDLRAGYGDVDCAATTCVAVRNDDLRTIIARSTDGGVTWHTASVPTAAGSLSTVSCASDRCYIVQDGPHGNPVVVSGAP